MVGGYIARGAAGDLRAWTIDGGCDAIDLGAARATTPTIVVRAGDVVRAATA